MNENLSLVHFRTAYALFNSRKVNTKIRPLADFFFISLSSLEIKDSFSVLINFFSNHFNKIICLWHFLWSVHVLCLCFRVSSHCFCSSVDRHLIWKDKTPRMHLYMATVTQAGMREPTTQIYRLQGAPQMRQKRI